MMRYNKEIELRCSRRSYNKQPLEENEIRRIQNLIDKVNEKEDLRFLFIEDGQKLFNGLTKSYGLFSGVRSLIVIKGLKNDPDLEEKCGYYGEWLILEATALELGTCWVGGTFDRKSHLLNIGEGERMIGVITVGHVDPAGFKENLIHQAMASKRKSPQEISRIEGEVPSWFIQGIEAASKAPSALMRQKTRFFYRGGKAIVITEDEHAFDRVDLGIAKLHFECAALGKFHWGNPADFIKKTEQE